MTAAVCVRKSNDQALPDVEKAVVRQLEHARAYCVRQGWIGHPVCLAAQPRDLQHHAGDIASVVRAHSPIAELFALTGS